MKTNVVRIGNSRGIRIPKKLLEECRLEETVELEAHKDHLVVRSVPKPRAGWDEAFRRMVEQGDDALLDRDSFKPFNRCAPFKSLNTKVGSKRSRVPIVPNVRGIKTKEEKIPCSGLFGSFPLVGRSFGFIGRRAFGDSSPAF